MKRIGVMGCGAVASYGHLPAIAETPGLVLAALYDPNPAQLAALADRFPQTPRFTDSESFFRSALDAVTVSSPAPFHLDNVRQAAAHGLHVLCEKPLAMNESEIEQMMGIMEDAGLHLATAFCYRFSPVAQQIKQVIGQGAIGAVRVLRLIYNWNLHGKWIEDADGQRAVSPLRLGRMREGGPMVDCGVHQIDLATWWLDSPVVRQVSDAAWVESEFEAPDHVWLHLTHANGVHAHIETSFSYTHTARDPLSVFTYEIIGTGGVIRYDRDGWRFEVRNEHGTWTLPGASEKNFHGMYATWRDALSSGDFTVMPSAQDGLTVTRIARQATESALANRPSLPVGALR